jgi:dTMP kinase
VTLPGRFITFEGLDGSGKSTQLNRAAEYLRALGHKVIATREPGGTDLGQQLRDLLLHAPPQSAISPLAELLLMFGARVQHIEQVIGPALKAGALVLCDRFTDSSVAYQGYGRGVPLAAIHSLDHLLERSIRPGLTLLLDIAAAASAQRTGQRNRETLQPHTRFEKEGADFFERVRQGYLAIAREEPQRVKVVEAGQPVEEVWAAVKRELDSFLRK